MTTKATKHVVVFKHENEVDGVAVGPVVVYTRKELDEAEASGSLGVPYNPDRITRWVTLPEARAVASEHGTTLEES